MLVLEDFGPWIRYRLTLPGNRVTGIAKSHDEARGFARRHAVMVLGSRVTLTEELLELEKRIAADTARRSEILALLT